ncbi:MAG: hypothetical protein MJ241_03695 [Bacilli bacterium]|nr:hypothetical protein [Bacilli bacterium]
MNSIRQVLSSLKKADNDFNLISNGDKIVVYIDGSSSSIALAKALDLYKFYSKKKYRLVLTAIDYGFNAQSIDFLKAEFTDINIIDGEDVVMMMNAKGKDASASAFLKLERKQLAMFAKDVKAKKIALASTHEDSLEYLFRSVVTEGKIITLKPKSSVYGSNVSFIRPLISCYESNIDKYINELELSVPPLTNPWVKHHTEEFVKINEMINDSRKDAKDNIRKALSDEFPILYADSKEFNLETGVMKKSKLSNDERSIYLIYKKDEKIGSIAVIMLDHHLAQIEYSLNDDPLLLGALDKIIDELVDKCLKITLFFSRPKKVIREHLGLKKINIRGKQKFAIKKVK